jgi:small-conductance mechanosensitive channel
MSLPTIIYLAFVAVVGFGLLLRTWLWLRWSHLKRRLRLETRENIDPVNTRSPVGDPSQLTTRRGLESIQRQFTVHQLVLIPAILLLTLLAAAIPFLGDVPATFVTLIAAAVTVILGVAARPLIENAIAGLVIAFSKLVSIGDTVKMDGFYGTIEDITATHTTIKLWDWRRYVVPNTRMLEANLVNYSLTDTFVWVSVEFHVTPLADIDQVREIALAAPRASSSYRDYEPPRFWVMELGKEHVCCWVAAWSDNPPEAWMLGHDIRTELIRQLRRHGIQTHLHRLELGGPVPHGAESP